MAMKCISFIFVVIAFCILSYVDAQDTSTNRAYIYDEKAYDFFPGGYMPDGNISIYSDLKCETLPYKGKNCYEVSCQMKKNTWMAVAWLPGGSFDSTSPGVNIYEKLNAKQGDEIILQCWARSPNKTTIQLKCGGVPKDSIKFAVATDWLELSDQWQLISLNVTDEDLSCVRAALIWVVDKEHNPKNMMPKFYLDEIYFTKLQKK